jgi:hypothetical protein
LLERLLLLLTNAAAGNSQLQLEGLVFAQQLLDLSLLVLDQLEKT